MIRNIALLTLFIISAGLSSVAAQTPANVKPSVVAGDVTALGDKSASINTAAGPVQIVFSDKTIFKRVSAVNPDFKTATDGALADIGIADKLTVTGFPSVDGKTLPARTVYFITKADIASKNAKEADEWRRRGVAGKVTNVNTQTGQLTIEVRGLVGSTNTVLTPKGGAQFLKYAPDSIRFDEAVASSLPEVKVGDMLRALGDKSSDGTSFSAERIITGAFQTIAGTVTSIDAEKNEIVIKNLQDNKPMTVAISDFTVIKKFPQEMAERLAGGQMGGAGGGARPVGGGNVQVRPVSPGGQPQAAGPGGRPGFGGGAASGSIDEMIDRFPSMAATDLAPGDMIAFSSSKNGNAVRVKAIKVLAGVEPFIRMAQASTGGRRGVDGGFSIPGLDGMGP